MRSSSLLLGGAAWSPPSLDGVALLFSFCERKKQQHHRKGRRKPSSTTPQKTGERAPSPKGGEGRRYRETWSPPPLGGVAVFPSPFAWCCLTSPSFFQWGSLFPCPPLGGAAWFPLLLREAAFLSSYGWGEEIKQHHQTEDRENATPPNEGEGRQPHQKDKEKQQHHPKGRVRPSSTS